MQPYQEASEEIRRRGEMPARALKKAASAIPSVVSAFAGGAAISRVLPFLSKYIPQDLAVKGLSKIDPRFGKFVEKSLAGGSSFDEVRDFIKDKAEGPKSEENTNQNRNIVEQYSPELHQFIMDEIQKGRSPLEAAARATLGKKGESDFKKVIEKMVRDHKTPWSAIIETVYGGQGQKNNPQNPQMNQQKQQQQTGNDKWNSIAQTLQSLLNS